MIATSNVREHMEVIGSDGGHVGTVDFLEGDDRIALTRSDAPDGHHHHFLSTVYVDLVDEQVHLNITAEEAMQKWEHSDEESLELEEEEVSERGKLAGESDIDKTEEEEDDWIEDRR